MPHISLQYHDLNGKTYDFRHFFHQLHSLLKKVAGIKPEDCKSRVIPISEATVGTGPGDQDFVHLEIRLLEGRSPGTKRMIGDLPKVSGSGFGQVYASQAFKKILDQADAFLKVGTGDIIAVREARARLDRDVQADARR